MKSFLLILFIVLFPASAMAQITITENGYIVQTGDTRKETNSLNGWTYVTTSGSTYTNINDSTFYPLSYDANGRIVSYAINGQTRSIVYGDDATSQAKENSAIVSALHTVNTLTLLASQRAIDRTIFDRLFTTLITNNLRGKGLAAGDEPASAVATWVDGSYTSQGSTQAGSQYDSNQYILMAGLDYTMSERLTLGFSTGFNQNYTEFHLEKTGSQRDDYFIFNPYAGISLFDNACLGLQAGLKYGQTSLTGKTTTDYQSLTLSAGGFATYAFIRDRFMFNPVVGYTYSSRTPYADSMENSAVGILKAGGRFTYQFEKVIPYLDLSYNYDTIGQPQTQRSDMLGTLGADFLLTQQLRASLLVSNTFFRDKEYCTTFDLNLRYSF